MNPLIKEKINTLLLLCMEVTAEGVWHCNFDYSGHVNSIDITATNSDHPWTKDNPTKATHAFDRLWIRLYQLNHISETDADHIARVTAELDAAYAAVESLLKQEVPYAA